MGLLKELTLCTRVILEKTPVGELLKKFPAFYGTQRFIATFTKTCHWFPSSAAWKKWNTWNIWTTCPI
jgi:hypothetical protein